MSEHTPTDEELKALGVAMLRVLAMPGRVFAIGIKEHDGAGNRTGKSKVFKVMAVAVDEAKETAHA